MEDNDEIVASDAFEEVDECSIKIEQQVNQKQEGTAAKYFNFNLEVSDLLETGNSKLRRSKRIKKSTDTKLLSQVYMLKPHNSTAEQNLGSKYRPIRPKPYTTSDKAYTSKNKLLGISPALNMSALSSSNRFIVTSIPSKGKIQDVTVLDGTSSNETSSYIKSLNGIPTLTKEINDNKNGTGSNVTAIGQNQRIAKILNKRPKRSIELFFDSMAQTVSKLPAYIQAEIKMEICKLVTKAEISHYGSQSR